jgi:hypothetical protein
MVVRDRKGGRERERERERERFSLIPPLCPSLSLKNILSHVVFFFFLLASMARGVFSKLI